MRTILSLLSLLVLVSGCGSENLTVTNPTPVPKIWPLKVGNQWTLENRVTDSLGDLVRVDTSVVLIAKDTVIQQETWYIPTVNGVRDPDMNLVTNRNSGLWQGGSNGYLLFKYPAKAGDTYVIPMGKATVLSVNDTMQVPVGTFICHTYKWVGDGEVNRAFQWQYFAPGVGWVASVEFYKTPGGTVYPGVYHLLISYELK